MEDPAKEDALSGRERRWLMGLTMAALLSRMLWVGLVHPPQHNAWSDMLRYVDLAMELLRDGFHRDPDRAFWPWGTPALLALPLWLFGAKGLFAAGILWGLLSAAMVPMAFMLGRLAHPRMAVPVALFALCWPPDLSHAGFFLSETPYRTFLMMHTLGLGKLARRGRGAWLAGVGGALAFAIRPQSALFTGFAALAWLLLWRKQTGPRRLLGVALPMALVFVFSMVRFHEHTGRWGIAANGSPNLTIGRCQLAYMQAFPTQAALNRAEAADDVRAGSRVGVPALQQLYKMYPKDHPLGLRPALGKLSLRFVGSFADPKIHKALRARCYAATGWLGQLRISVSNMHLLWFAPKPWPEMTKSPIWLAAAVDISQAGFLYVLFVPSTIGMVLALARPRRDPIATLAALQLLAMMIIAALFFGEPRLRATTDVYAFLLALSLVPAAKNAWSTSSKR